MRTDPPPSVPICNAPIPSAAATAAPPLDPPGVLFVFHGLRVIPVNGLSVTPFQPNSGVVVRPIKTTPFLRKFLTHGASSVSGAKLTVAFDPRPVTEPFVMRRSLIVIGTPSKRPAGSPAIQRFSDSRASIIAVSSLILTKAFTNLLTVWIRPSTSLATSTGDNFFDL